MDPKIAARMIVVVAIGAGLTAAIAALHKEDVTDAEAPRIGRPGGEPVNTELARCRAIGLAAADDAACRTAWAQNRRRFFATDRPAAPNDKKDKAGHGADTGEVAAP